MKKGSYIVILLSLILFGCQNFEQTTVSPPTPEADRATIHGNILTEDETPMSNIVVRLAQVYGSDKGDENAAFILDEANSPSTVSEEDGSYIFINIEPGEYVLFIGQLHNEYMVVSDSDQNPNVYDVSPGEILKIEPIIVVFN